MEYDLLALTKVNAIAISTIPPKPRSVQIDLEDSLASHRGQTLVRIGRVEEEIKQVELAYELFCKDQPRNLHEEAWPAEKLADGLAAANRFTTALDSQEKVRDHWLERAEENRDGLLY
ncbi:hypothetical protein F5Y07DRAFT_372159 [Xylaria sp. FL0933]|nr:hypothetical protein F5Y07DRAFT_372159 [Xylaria sp. FL0933]